MVARFLRSMLMLLVFATTPAAYAADVLRGHGGPVRSIAMLGSGGLVSGAFDHAVIVWDHKAGVAQRVLRFHEGAVNAIAVLSSECFASAGEDGRIAVWCGPETTPQRVLEGHGAPVSALSLSGDGRHLVSASWDGTARVWDWQQGALERTVEGHNGPVSAVLALSGSLQVLSGGFDGQLRLAPGAGRADRVVALTSPINALARASDGEIIAASADGKLHFFSPQLEPRDELEVEQGPIAALAVTSDGKLAAAAGLRGGISIVERAGRRIAARLVGPGLPVWSLAFDADNRTLFTGGADRVIRKWDAVIGEPIGAVVPEPSEGPGSDPNERGAVLFRACQACHSLQPEAVVRAGPPLYGVFGRRIATAPGYRYSEALKRLDIVWTAETIARLFELGPSSYTPGTKMPEQTIGNAEDRQALVAWLEKMTRPRQ